jgi:hypothetical protein
MKNPRRREALEAAIDDGRFTVREVRAARVFCVAVGALLLAGGAVALARASGGAAITGGVAAAAGALLAAFGLLAAPRHCVKVAGFVLGLF